jgi:hypothetical protein
MKSKDGLHLVQIEVFDDVPDKQVCLQINLAKAFANTTINVATIEEPICHIPLKAVLVAFFTRYKSRHMPH